MDAIEFVRNYPKYLAEIEGVIRTELLSILQQLKETDPEDLISVDTWFLNENQARGYVWKLFLRRCNHNKSKEE